MWLTALLLPGCSNGPGLKDPLRPRFSMHQTGPDGTVFEQTDHSTRALWFEDNDPDGELLITNPALEHGEGPVTGDGCVTATTLHVPYGFSLTFGPDGAIVDPDHMFRFTVANDDFRRPEWQYLFGGQVSILEHTEERISLELDGALWCSNSDFTQCATETLVPQPAPYQLTIDGTFVVPLGTSEVRSTGSLYTDPTTGQPLCEAFQREYPSNRD